MSDLDEYLREYLIHQMNNFDEYLMHQISDLVEYLV